MSSNKVVNVAYSDYRTKKRYHFWLSVPLFYHQIQLEQFPPAQRQYISCSSSGPNLLKLIGSIVEVVIVVVVVV